MLEKRCPWCCAQEKDFRRYVVRNLLNSRVRICGNCGEHYQRRVLWRILLIDVVCFLILVFALRQHLLIAIVTTSLITMPLDLIRPYERVVMGREALQKVAKDSKSIEVALCFRGVRDGGLLFGKYIISEDCIFEMRDREGNAFGEGCYAVLTYFNPLSSKHKAKIRMIGKESALEEMKYRHTLLLYSKQRCVAEVIALNT